jgi:hypothetical protein
MLKIQGSRAAKKAEAEGDRAETRSSYDEDVKYSNVQNTQRMSQRIRMMNIESN